MEYKEDKHSQTNSQLHSARDQGQTLSIPGFEMRSNPAGILQRAKLSPGSITPADIIQLQHTIGNQAVAQLLAEMEQNRPGQHTALGEKHEAAPDISRQIPMDNQVSIQEKNLHIAREQKKSNPLEYPTGRIQRKVPVDFSFTAARRTVQRAKAQYVNAAIPATIAGNRGAANAGYTAKTAPTAGAKDYLKAINYDGAFATPVSELITQLNLHYQGKNTGLAAPNDKVPQLTRNKTNLTSPVGATYRRPFEVHARTSAPRGVGRSNNSGIETEIGRMGHDEYLIRKGASPNMEGGHLVGDQIMDSHGSFLLYEDWNLAPQHANFNAPIYLTAMENAAANAVTAGGVDLEYKVNLQYPDNTYTETASNLATRAGIWSGTYGTLLDNAVKKVGDQNITFTRRVPGYWKAAMNDLNKSQSIASNIRDDVQGRYDGAAMGPALDYKPPAGEYFRYTATADGAVMGPLVPPNTNWNVAMADELSLETRQETP